MGRMAESFTEERKLRIAIMCPPCFADACGSLASEGARPTRSWRMICPRVIWMESASSSTVRTNSVVTWWAEWLRSTWRVPHSCRVLCDKGGDSPSLRSAGEPLVGRTCPELKAKEPSPANLFADVLTAGDTIFVVTGQDECSTPFVIPNLLPSTLSFRIRFSGEESAFPKSSIKKGYRYNLWNKGVMSRCEHRAWAMYWLSRR